MVAQPQSSSQPAAEPIAVIGLSCRFPGAADADAFWRLLADGGDAITEVPRDRWDADALYDPDLAERGTTSSRWGGFIDGVDQFDPHFFGISPGEAAGMDPQHRLLLEVTWEALERAGIVPARLAGSAAGVYVGIGTDDYAQVAFADPADVNAYYVSGNALSIAVNRLSYLLDLRGPSLALDTGCSSSLVAVHMACQSLRAGETTVALAGGVNLMLSPKATIGLSQTWMMAADGRCKSFAAAADGYVRSEGCGMVVLKRLADARHDGDPILAVIRGTAMNHNGYGEALTAPAAAAQEAVIREALRDAAAGPGDIDLIEAHGVGTQLADVAEARALTSVFGVGRDPARPCVLGSVKTNIGHLEMAAGIASLIKVVLSLRHETAPPHLHLDMLNPRTGLADAPFVLPATPLPWLRGVRPRLAGINSFGLGGVNVHMVVAEPPATVDAAPVSRPAVMTLPLSARTEPALRALAERYVAVLSGPDAPDFAAVCATAAVGRTHFAHRLAVVAADAASAAAELTQWLTGADSQVHHGVSDPALDRPSAAIIAGDAAGFAIGYVQGGEPEPVAVLPQPRVILPTYPFQRKRYWIDAAPTGRADRIPEVPQLVRLIAETAPAARRTRLAQAVNDVAAEILGGDDGAVVDPRQGLFDLGMDSLMAVAFQNRLQQAIGSAHRLPATLVFEYSSVAAVTDYLAWEVFQLDSPHPARPRPSLALTQDALSAMSDDEAMVLLRRHIAEAAPDGSTHLSPVKQALLALGRGGAGRPAPQEPIAVVGMGCRLPGGVNSPDEFWRLLRDGVDTVGAIPDDRWDVADFYDADPDRPGRMYTRAGHFVDGIDQFDPGFFGISPREAVSLDPQQRMLLEVAWAALEHAGVVPDRLVGTSTGVFVGLISNEYMQLQVKLADPTIIDTYYGTGGIGSAVAGRLSYLLGLQGPSMAVDTACSSSLVAVHLACRSLRSGESDLALAGGVSLMIVPESYLFLSRAHALSPDGRCKTFDASADGYGRGEGCGVVVLKRLSDALRDGDRVLAVVRGSAVNHDGPSGGLTVPNGLAQQALIRAALADAGVGPSDVDYVEAHGTGTALGDPIEVAAIGAVLGQHRPADRALRLGSVKANIGHLEAAAGVAGLIKLIQALRQEQLPPQVNFTTANPKISLAQIPAQIPVAAVAWPRAERVRVAGVSSFGMSGTNAHLVLSEAPVAADPVQSGASGRASWVLPLSARDDGALRALAERYAALLESGVDFASVCAAAALTRSHFPHRLAVVAGDATSALARLRAWLDGEPDRLVVEGAAGSAAGGVEIGWLFSGQGTQWAGMARGLYDIEPVFRTELERCAGLLTDLMSRPLLEILYANDAAGGSGSLLDETEFTQPALFAVEWSLAQLWRHWGVEPKTVLGHSIGELVAACVAEVLPLEEGLRLAAARGRLMQELPAGGGMLAIALPHSDVVPLLKGTDLVVAAVNSPIETVVAGPLAAIEVLRDRLAAGGTRATVLRVSHAFHSPLMLPMLPALHDVGRMLSPHEPRCTVVSNVTGDVAGAGFGSAEYWAQHAVAPVRFADGVRALVGQGCTVVQEIGPHPVLCAAGRVCVQEGVAWVPSLRRGGEDWQEMSTALANLYVQGVELNWGNIYAGVPARAVELPLYPFQRQRYWVDTSRLPRLDDSDWLYERVWRPQELQAAEHSGASHWLILADATGVAEAVAASLRRQGDRCSLVRPGDGFVQLPDGGFQIAPDQPGDFGQLLSGNEPVAAVLHLWSLDPVDPQRLDAAHERACASLLHLVQAAAPLDSAAPRIWVVTSGAQPVAGTSGPRAPYSAPLWGLGPVVELEHPTVWGGLIDVDPGSDDAAAAIIATIRAAARENQVAWRNGGAHVARVTRVPRRMQEHPAEIAPEGTHLITGGLGGLGLLVARWLVDRGARHLVLAGRREPDAPAEETLQQLAARGAQVRVLRADVGREDDVRRVLADVEAFMPPLRGVFHAAGVLDDGALHQQSWQRFERVFAPKVRGAWHLHLLTYDLPLDHFVLFSSIASMLGSPGQGNYAAANAFLDVLAHHRQAQGLAGVSVNWGAWGGAGMAARLTDREQQRWTARGITPIPPERGIRMLERILGCRTPQLGVVPVDWTRYAEGYPLGAARPLLAELVRPVPGSTTPPEIATARLRERFAALPPAQRQPALTGYVTGELAKILMLDERSLDPHKGLFDLGMDSLMALEFRNRVQAALDHEVPATLLFNYPTVQAIAGYLATVLFGEPRAADTPRPPSTEPGDDLEGLLDRLEHLSDDEIDRLLADGSTAEGQAPS